jgi:DNA-binding transcriptional MocR family regulator
MRANNVMASPLSAALATRWIEDGTADNILHFVRTEAMARQALVANILPEGSYRGDPLSFNIWLPLAQGWTRSTFGSHMRSAGIGVVASDAFCVDGPAIQRTALEAALEFMGHALQSSPEMAGSFF